ncbi:out at first protein-like [Branchiostoma floridae]|uniref:Out at first protein homolog n=1 Tax=Branchiostoma floridae TaxID=7739 RepID=A0A9J7L8Z7_BRAFL|nr:out at first protein-like [Branchiostoma floridae]
MVSPSSPGCVLLVVLLLWVSAGGGTAQLVVNVRNRGGDVTQESIMADTDQDIITLEFQKSDGTLVTMVIDFKSEVQIFKALILGEMERGQSQYQVICQVTKFSKNEFISSDAMSKLRQKNPGTIRNAEDDKGQEHLVMDMGVDLEKSAVISRHIYNICAEAGAATYTRETDLKYLAKGDNKTLTTLLQATRRLTPSRAVRCMDSSDWLKPCTCQLEICIGWYPCGLKYCRGKDGNGKVINYRCGIKTCRKCRQFDYHVKQKQLCVWDEMWQ